MKPVLLSRSQINDQQWDNLIRRSQQRIVYGLSWYLDTVCEDWNALVWPSNENYEVVMPLPIKKKWSFAVVEQPLFCQYLGIFSASDLTTQHVFHFFEAFSFHFFYISAYSFHPLNFRIIGLTMPQFSQLKFKENHTYWLSLQNPFETIQTGYSYDRKSNLKRSKKYDWVVERSEDSETIVELFKNHHQDKVIGGVNQQAYLIFKKLVDKLISEKCIGLWYTSRKNIRHAGALFVKEGEMAIYLFNSADDLGRKGNARTYLIDQYFKSNAGNNINFDFESPEVESIANFYKSFGGEKKSFITISKNDLPTPFKQIQEWRKRLMFKTR